MAFTLKITLVSKIMICLVYYPNSIKFKGYKTLFYKEHFFHYEILVPLQINLCTTTAVSNVTH